MLKAQVADKWALLEWFLKALRRALCTSRKTVRGDDAEEACTGAAALNPP